VAAEARDASRVRACRRRRCHHRRRQRPADHQCREICRRRRRHRPPPGWTCPFLSARATWGCTRTSPCNRSAPPAPFPAARARRPSTRPAARLSTPKRQRTGPQRRARGPPQSALPSAASCRTPPWRNVRSAARRHRRSESAVQSVWLSRWGQARSRGAQGRGPCATRMALGPPVCAVRQATVATGDRSTSMIQAATMFTTWGDARATHVTHSSVFDPDWYRKAFTCLARLLWFGRFGLRSHAVRDMLGTYSTDATSFRCLRRRWYVSFVGNHRLRPATPRLTGLRSLKGRPLYFTHYVVRWQRIGPLAADHSEGNT